MKTNLAMPFRRDARTRGLGVVKVLLVVALIALIVGGVWAVKPEWFRFRVQTPVSIKVRDSLVGRGKKIRVTNESEKTLEEVVVTAVDPESNERERYKIETLAPDDTVDIGWTKWSWKLGPGQRIEVDAKGYLPIVFSSKQLGIE